MFDLTRLEQQAILFVTCSLLLGSGITLVRSYEADIPVKEAHMLQVDRTDHSDSVVAISDTTQAMEPEQVQLTIIDLNTASSRQLQSLPGIGPKLAERIVIFRQKEGRFLTTDQLLKVKGIGPAVMSRIKPLITVQ